LIEEERQAKKKYKREMKRIEDIYNYEKSVLDNLYSKEEQVICNDTEVNYKGNKLLIKQN
jgi:hypothetical protein